MPYTVIVDRAHWVCETCRDENSYTGPDAAERALQGGAMHKCERVS